MRDPVLIIVTPLGRGRYQARQGDRVLVRSTSEPLLSAARALLAEGVAPDTRIATRHPGANHDALSSTIDTAAGLTVEAARNGRPRFARWRVGRDAGISPPVRFLGVPAPDIAPHLTALHGDEVTA